MGILGIGDARYTGESEEKFYGAGHTAMTRREGLRAEGFETRENRNPGLDFESRPLSREYYP